MSLPDQRFLCPHCRQKLSCEDGYGGWQIQCPACNGPVIVPLPATVAPVGGAFWGPPTLQRRAAGSSAAAPATLGKWQQRGILVGAALLFSTVVVLGTVRWVHGLWPWSPRVSALEVELWFGLGLVGFSTGAAYTTEFTDSLVARVCGGCFIAVLVGAFVWSALGVLGGGCGAGCASNPKEKQEMVTVFHHSCLWFIGTVFLWAVLQGWLHALDRR